MDRKAIESTASLIESYPDIDTKARFDLIMTQLGSKALSQAETNAAREVESFNFRLIGQLVELLPQAVVDPEGTEAIEIKGAESGHQVQANIVLSSYRSVPGLCYIIGQKPSPHKPANDKQRMFTNLLFWPARPASPVLPHVVEVPELDYRKFKIEASRKLGESPSEAELNDWLDPETGKLYVTTKYSVGSFLETNHWIRKSGYTTRLAELAPRDHPVLKPIHTFEGLLPDYQINRYNLVYRFNQLVHEFGVEGQAVQLLRAEAAELK